MSVIAMPMTARGGPSSYAMSGELPPADACDIVLEEFQGEGRSWRLELRPGMKEGQYMALCFRRWGQGHWMIAEGQPSFYSNREHIRLPAQRWIESGR